MKRAAEIIAETLGWDVADIRDYKYQRYLNPLVYSVGGRYYAAHPTKPRHPDVGGEWRLNPDQFGARGTDNKIWVCGEE